jgi:hypothetical protein
LTAGTFSATGVPVTVTTSGGIETIAQLVTSTVNGTTSGVTFNNPALFVIQNTPFVSGPAMPDIGNKRHLRRVIGFGERDFHFPQARAGRCL